MRGKVLRENGSVYEIRITPAYAGKRMRKAKRAPAWKDHPRLCGEKWKLQMTTSLEARITPAYAGKRTPVW